MTADIRLYPVVMCGGSGTRLWPASRPSRPKQFLPLVGQASLFAETVQRLAPSAWVTRFVVVAGKQHAGAVLRELGGMQLEADVLLEPEARDSGPAIAAAACWISSRDPQGIAVVLASDHHIPDAEAFRIYAEQAARFAASRERIVTLGIKPTGASSAYGYIQPGTVLEAGVCDLAAFVEKPTTAVAEQYVDAGYLWNSGNFIAPARVLVSELERLAPAVIEGAAAGVSEARSQGGAQLLGPSFRTAQRKSFDYAVMERTDKAAVLPVDLAWSDLGAWDAVHQARARDETGNSVRGTVVLARCDGNLIQAAPGMIVAVRGVSGLAIVADPDAVLVTPLDQAQGVKDLVDGLKAQGAPQQDMPRHGPSDLGAAADDLKNWLFGSALPVWFSLGFDHDGTGAAEQMTAVAGVDQAPRRARVQPRQAHAFAVAARIGWQGPARVAQRMSLDAMDRIYRRADGQVVALASADGRVLDPSTRLYDQAFVLLALASAGELRPDAEASALSLLDVLETDYRHDSGGFAEASGDCRSDALMHLLEAALAWCQSGTSRRWRDLAAELAGLAMTRMMDPQSGAIGEQYAADWTAAPGAAGARLEPGHQFEWAWLLVRWWRLSGESAALEAARRLYDVGASGIDPVRDVAVDGIARDGRLLAGSARLWPQTEWLKAAVILAEEAQSGSDRTRLVADALRAAATVRQYLPDRLRGLWYDVQDDDGAFRPGPSPASTLYHLVEAVGQLLVSAQSLRS